MGLYNNAAPNVHIGRKSSSWKFSLTNILKYLQSTIPYSSQLFCIYSLVYKLWQQRLQLKNFCWVQIQTTDQRFMARVNFEVWYSSVCSFDDLFLEQLIPLISASNSKWWLQGEVPHTRQLLWFVICDVTIQKLCDTSCKVNTCIQFGKHFAKYILMGHTVYSSSPARANICFLK